METLGKPWPNYCGSGSESEKTCSFIGSGLGFIGFRQVLFRIES